MSLDLQILLNGFDPTAIIQKNGVIDFVNESWQEALSNDLVPGAVLSDPNLETLLERAKPIGRSVLKFKSQESLILGYKVRAADLGDGRYQLVCRPLLDKNKQILDSVNRIQAFFFSKRTRDVFNSLLDAILGLTNSEYGFIGEVLYNAEGKPYLKTYAITDISWNEATRTFYEQGVATGLDFTNLDSLFGQVMVTADYVIANNPKNDTRATGIPEGHPDLNYFLGIPLFAQNKLVGMAGIANRPCGYDMKIVETLSPLSVLCGNLIQEWRNQSHREELETEFSNYFNLSLSMFCIADTHGKFYKMNQAWEHHLGYKVEKLLNFSLFDLLHPNDLAFMKEKIGNLITPGETAYFENRYRRKDGEYRWLAWTVIVEERNGLIYVAAHDISELKQAYSDLQNEKVKVEHANTVKSEFLANMSHEIRTPMNAIMGMTDLVLDSPLSKEQRDYLEIVEESAAGLLRLINDILDFSKIEAGKLDLEHVSFNLLNKVQSIVKTHELRASQKGYPLILDVDPQLPSYVVGDPVRLGQVLINLIGNAIKFTEDGSVTINLKQEKGSAEEVLVRFEVKDTGIGIPQKQLTHIFDAFSQADGSHTRIFGGTGLGLSISSQLVELMGGTLDVTSEVGEGSCFYFTLRLMLHPEPDDDHTKLTLENIANRSALILEQNRTHSHQLETFLRSWGIETVCYADELNFFNDLKTAQQQFDLIFLDNKMVHDQMFLRLTQKDVTKDALIFLLINVNERPEFDYNTLVKPIRQDTLYHMVKNCFKEPKQTKVVKTKDKTHHILVVEDNRVNQLLAKKLLQRLEYDVSQAFDGRDGVNCVKNGNYDLVLMDIQMPEMDGFKATKLIRAFEAENNRERIPIVAVTAHAMKGDEQRCIDEGMDDYISKPIQRDELAQKLKKFLP